MGYDDNGTLHHENINSGPLTDAVGVLAFRPSGTDTVPNNLTFTGQRNDKPTVLMTITPEGQLLPGPGLSSEVAAQQVAAMLVSNFAVELNERIKAAEAETAAMKRQVEALHQELNVARASAKNWEWQFTESDKKLGELMLGLTSIHVSPFTDPPK